MNKQFPLISAALVVMTMSASAPAFAVTLVTDTLAQWTFETTPPADAPNSAIYPNLIAADVGAGNASGVHAKAATDWTTPIGNGSANSFASSRHYRLFSQKALCPYRQLMRRHSILFAFEVISSNVTQ